MKTWWRCLIVMAILCGFLLPFPRQTLATAALGNGHVETASGGYSTDGWGCFVPAQCSLGSYQAVSSGANGTAYAMQYTSGGIWGSLVFNLGPKIIQDSAYGYAGGGAGVYTITFWAKLASSATTNAGIFNMMLNSECHIDTPGQATFFDVGTITMTKSWQKFSVTATVTDEFLERLQSYRNMGNVLAYNLDLRFDGSRGIFSGKSNSEIASNVYLVDEVSISDPGDDVDETVVGRMLTFTKATSCFCQPSWKFVTSSMVKNNVVTFPVTVGNNNQTPVTLTASLQVMDSAKGILVDVKDLKSDTYTLQPHTYHTFTVTAASTTSLSGGTMDYSAYVMRFDGSISQGLMLSISGLKPGALQSIQCDSANTMDMYMLPTWKNATATPAPTKKTTAQTASPVGALPEGTDCMDCTPALQTESGQQEQSANAASDGTSVPLVSPTVTPETQRGTSHSPWMIIGICFSALVLGVGGGVLIYILILKRRI